ncbi:MAG TPA: ribosome maturation factor RimP [Gammaproteobacteria bacterium]|nr:ribosome maturation factor RimP [Gammaproteobacteria bacterium]
MRNVTPAALEAILIPALAAVGYTFWGCQVEFSKRPVLRIFMDKTGGVTVDDCTHASHHIKAVLAVEAKGLDDYILEVSSPGMDRQLFKLEHYEQCQGSEIKLRLRRPLENQRNFQGKIEKIENNAVILHTEKGLIGVEFENIERAQVVPEMKIEGKKR